MRQLELEIDKTLRSLGQLCPHCGKPGNARQLARDVQLLIDYTKGLAAYCRELEDELNPRRTEHGQPTAVRHHRP